MFLRKTKAREPLPLTMAAVRLGERLLQIGVDDRGLVGALAAKVGMSGTAAIVTVDAAEADRARSACREAGALVEVTNTRLESLPFPESSFDVVVVHDAPSTGAPSPAGSGDVLRECSRVLRPGGRGVVITRVRKPGFAGLLRSAPAGVDAKIVESTLAGAGFRAVRVVGELEGLRFIEGLRA